MTYCTNRNHYGTNRWILRLVGPGFLGDAADSLGADNAVKNMAKDYAKDKVTDFAKDKALAYVDRKISGRGKKSRYKETDKTDKYWYLKEED